MIAYRRGHPPIVTVGTTTVEDDAGAATPSLG